jgi:hypothetical protein
MDAIQFEELEAALESLGAPVSAGEAHGALCGRLAVSGHWTAADWIRELAPDPVESGQLVAGDVLEMVFQDVQSTLTRDQMEFSPLLPAEDAPLEVRTAALAAWCAGFLHGTGTGGIGGGEVPEEVREVLRDFVEIGQAIVGEADGEEANEEAYTELVEYLRVSVQLVYDTFASQRADGENA